MTQRDTITLIGTGNVGTSLHQALIRNGYASVLVGKNQDQQRHQAARSKLVLITVQDHHIKGVCDHISDALAPNSVVAHCSGALSSQILNSAQTHGAFIGSAHPLNTFPNPAAALSVLARPNHNTHCYISGEPEASTRLTSVFKRLGFQTATLSDDTKMAYHTACVFACNYLTSLAELSLQTAELADINREEFWQAIQPLMQATLSNISQNGTAQALSGPIARGDADTVAKHLELLKHAPKNTQDAYRILGQQALALTEAQSRLSDDTTRAIKTLLS